MEPTADNKIKHREISFSKLHPDPNQAQTAILLLSDIEGVIHAHFVSPTFMRISYDVMHITLEQIEDILDDGG